MDEQQTQALAMIFQQMMQGLQQGMQILQGGGQPSADDDMYDDDPYAGQADEGYNGDPYMAGGDSPPPQPRGDMPNRGNLHDRVSQLEEHTGLKKSASGLFDRVSALEANILGAPYRGNITDRVAQLEDAVLSKSARQNTHESAPDIIPLDSLIKSAIQQGISEGMGELQKTAKGAIAEYPTDLETRRQTVRRRQPPELELSKAGAGFAGYSDAELDEAPTFGDVLLAQYYAQKNGETLFPDDDD